MPLNLFSKLLDHEERHGVVIGTAYRNRTSGTSIIEFIAEDLRNNLKQKLNKTNFYSLLSDGSTDTSVTEKEAFFVITFNPTPGGSDKVQIEVNYFDLVEPDTADANGIVKAIKTSFEQVNIDYLEKLVGFGSDGASVIEGKRTGLRHSFSEKISG